MAGQGTSNSSNESSYHLHIDPTKTLHKSYLIHYKVSLDIVDLGYDYFLARFETKEDLGWVPREGLWFIGQHFLAIKPWQPEFFASNANLS